jgi:DNA-binding HxlR family transcriptional regulator
MLSISNKELGSVGECISVIEEVLAVIGGKWSFLVITHLKLRPLRFNELKRTIGGISTQSLTVFLRQLEKNDIVRREVFTTMPVTVEYSLTNKGLDYARLIEDIRQCGLTWRNQAAE